VNSEVPVRLRRTLGYHLKSELEHKTLSTRTCIGHRR